MLHEVSGEVLALGPRTKGVAFTTKFKKIRPLSIDETIEIDGIAVTGVKTTHGELVLKIGPFTTIVKPGPDKRIGWGSIGFDINVNGKRILNLGDTLLHEKEWEMFIEPDVLMIPIGGKIARNTMSEEEAIQAVKNINPKLVIPCHYNCPGLFSKTLNPADEEKFKKGVEALGVQCSVMHTGDAIDLNDE